ILKMSKGNVSSHVSQLESLGLIEVEYKNGIKGIKKIIKPKYNRIIIIFKDPQQL
ncbi:transcriptional regulator, partial [Sulfolobus sp. B5]